MTHHILKWLADVRERFELHPAAVLEIGSRIVNGSPRSVFWDAERYVGVDQQEGPGVDRVADAATLRLDERFDLVVCCETLEHVADPLAVVRTLHDHVSPGGHLIITTPANGFPDHKYPRDYWRIMPDAYREILFAGMDILELVGLPGPTTASVGKVENCY